MTSRKKKREYIAVNVKREWEPFLAEALKLPEVQKGLELSQRKRLPSSLGVWIIEQWLIKKTSFRFKHFNTYGNHITILDRKLGYYPDIYPKAEGKLQCDVCKSEDCEHIKYVLKNPEIMKKLIKEGWEPPIVEEG